MTFNSINKLNLRLVRAFTYLSQISLNVRYCSSKQHIISNTLSRLSIIRLVDSINALKALNLDIYYNDIVNLEILN